MDIEEKAECSACGKECAIDDLQWTGPAGDYICIECLGQVDYQNRRRAQTKLTVIN